MRWDTAKSAARIILLGFLGMGLFQFGKELVTDLWFLHVVRVNTERAARQSPPQNPVPAAAPAPGK